MHSRLLLTALACATASVLTAQPTNAPVPPPVSQALPRPAPSAPQPGEQRVYGPTGDTLIAQPAVDGILEGFRRAYHTGTAPRIVIFVNRALVDASAGSTKPEPATSASPGSHAAAPGGHSRSLTLADQQTVREIERLFGRAFRHAGAQLADQTIAAALLPDQPGERLLEGAARDRAALAQVADIAIEVLISSRNLVVPHVSGDVTYGVPDIQATAIRLKDAAILGQAAASDIVGKGVQAGRVIQQFDVSDITEATAIALMEDMLIGMKP